MLTIFETTEFAPASAAVAASCPPSAAPERGWQPAPKQPKSAPTGLNPAVGGSVSGPVAKAALAGNAESAAEPDAQSVTDLLHRRFYMISRRDHRTWRPPH